MKNENFEVLIANNEDLNRLINEKDIKGLNNFSIEGVNTLEFKNYIKEKYSQSFKEIYTKYTGQNYSAPKINALLRSVDFLAAKEIIEPLGDFLISTLDTSIETLSNLKQDIISNNAQALILQSDNLDKALDNIVINICNKFDANEKIKEKKNKIINSSLDICEILSKENPKKAPFKYAIYNMIMNNLEKVNDYGELEARFTKNKGKNISKKNRSRGEILDRCYCNYIINFIQNIKKGFKLSV